MAEALTEAAVLERPALTPKLRIQLSAMMFLQYAVWGLWAPILARHLATLPGFQTAGGGVNQWAVGLIYMTLPIASIISPFIGGQIADRYFAAQKFLAASQILGGAALLLVARLTSVPGVFAGMLVYNLIYAPTIALTNSISFQHWPNEQFGKIRAFGSIGWIVIGLFFGLWLEWLGKKLHAPVVGDCLYLAAVLSFVYGLFALSLPHTPPSKQASNPLAFLDAVGMLRNPAFAVMAAISFFAAMDMQCYFIWTQSFLSEGLRIRDSWISPVQTAGQICEMFMMLLLPFVLHRRGFRVTIAVGIAAWAVRDFIFAIGQPTPLVLGAISLHGVGYAFFFTSIFMFADAVAPKDIKSSAQSFLASVTIGCGMLVGSLLAGPVSSACGGDWHRIYLVPAVLCAACCVAFLVGFRPKEASAAA